MSRHKAKFIRGSIQLTKADLLHAMQHLTDLDRMIWINLEYCATLRRQSKVLPEFVYATAEDAAILRRQFSTLNRALSLNL